MKTYEIRQMYRYPAERITKALVRHRDDYEWAAYGRQLGSQIAKDFPATAITEGALETGRALTVVVMTSDAYHELLMKTRTEAYRRGRETGVDDERRRLRARLLEQAEERIAEVF